MELPIQAAGRHKSGGSASRKSQNFTVSAEEWLGCLKNGLRRVGSSLWETPGFQARVTGAENGPRRVWGGGGRS